MCALPVFVICYFVVLFQFIWQAGFSNWGTFFKNFQARYGCTPKEYREKNS